ncbi:PEP-CTERM sorting domain-containing protein [Haloferula chungangensis]|uniref:PEP-CTERM sorting domain-containing protein n=1 Tax=Haloferula chungangensis TaxID=1048331 RepID=A0ABW2LA88_9BACT
MNTMNKSFQLILVAGLVASNSEAAVVIGGGTHDGDFSQNTVANASWIERQNLDQGWYTNGGSWTVVGGVATKMDAGAVNNGIGQAVTMPTGVGSDSVLNISFNWGAAAAGNTIFFDVIGLYNNNRETASDDFFELSGTAFRASNLSNGAAGIDLLDGSAQAAAQVPTGTISLVAAAAGDQAPYSLAIDASSYAAIGGELGNLEYLAVCFRGDSGVTVDNVMIATIPEPTSTALVALGLGGLLARRRRI